MRTLLTLLTLTLLTPLIHAADTRPPNVIVILTDDLGYADVGCYGAPLIKTPRLDRMAAEGIRFTDFYAAANVCTPSRAALLTGCYPQRVGLGQVQPKGDARSGRVLYANSPYGLHLDEVTMGEVLKSRGYATGMVGKWHLGDAKPFLPTKQGFDSYFGIPYSNDMKPLVYMRGEEVIEQKVVQREITGLYTDESLKFIRANEGNPFFLYLAHNMPHTPIAASDRFKGKSAGGLYGDAVEELDDSTGRILDLLTELKLDAHTLMVFTSDNGPWHIRGEQGGSASPLRAGKGTTYEGGMRVPCLMRWPGKIPPGTVSGELVTMMDVMPTVAKFAGASAPIDRTIDGKDIADLLVAKPGAKSPHEAFFYYSGNRLNAIRSGQWKLKFQTTLQEETEYGKVENPQTPIEPKLYNLLTDPGEQKSVLKDHPDVVKRLTELAAAARKDLGDERAGLTGGNVRAVGEVPVP
ncbi:MAG: sulfatase [Planctomycetota bacterium]|nr:sulfatase [Planctomycetota bacterium]